MKGNGLRGQRNGRIFFILLGMSGLLAVLLVRLAWLQIAPSRLAAGLREDWRNEAVMQRERSLVLDSGRGDFYDRNGAALTGESYQALAVFPMKEEARQTDAAARYHALIRLAGALGVSEVELSRWMNGLREPAFWTAPGGQAPTPLTAEQAALLASLRLNGVRVLPYHNRYPHHYLAAQALGYVSQHPEYIRSHYGAALADGSIRETTLLGGAGLERALDPLLRGAGPTGVSFYTDAKSQPLPGLDMRLRGSRNPYYPLRVVTTLDRNIERRIEDYLERSGLKEGAVVVLDAKNGDVIAMASRPKLDPQHLGQAGSDPANHAIRAAVPGSVFKIVTEAAALESRAVRAGETFDCDGTYAKYGLHCWKKSGHGTLDLMGAFANSCNIAFASIAERLQPEQLAVTADKLGIGRRVGWVSGEDLLPLGRAVRLLPEEEGGAVFAQGEAARDGGVLAQTGIGQRDVRLSPLQAANMIVTLLNHGRVLQPRIVHEIRYANGQLVTELPVQASPSAYGQVSRKTARTLLDGMKAVVEAGTGKSIQAGKWRVAGKSGTAETEKAGKPRNNQWFAGYGPVDSPRYAVAVLAENRLPNTANQATALFRGVMDILASEAEAKSPID
ncbi:peptidoglycan D,D-transpeptidase FtsI family protein [Paenibacillus methanolicus]|uniref:Cell division protein FtsI/penicillin-binding protein 2 n=1 Tax=Paenibacillus methanolicus TaxID=582686 RepID=A0A5S5BVW5_9BACL|nr:penicillin-binding protein 2 [Paenibacillus methanolicus]TYP71119.1 cell division protein FtsI/penicillin-binding protein 2 [Paenibacillus methanolicus]